MNNFNSIYMKEMGYSNKSVKSYSKEDLYDGDSDALIGDIQSTENMLEFAETYNTLRSMNASAKIKMCKKLRNITRGYTRYQDSIESYLSHEISMEEAQEQENPNNDSKVENKPTDASNGEQNTEKKMAWYKRIWEAIKRIVNNIIMWIKKKIAKFCAWFYNKYCKGIPELEEIMGNPQKRAKAEKEFEKFSYENQSEDGIIELTPNIGENINKKLDEYKTICTKFALAVGEIVNKNDLSDEILNHFFQICYAQGAILKVNVPKYNGNVKQYITELKAVEKDIKYDHDPKHYVLNIASAKLLQKETTISESLGTNSISETNKILNSITNSLGSGFEKRINEIQNILDNADKSFEKYMSKTYEIIKKGDEKKMKKEIDGIQVIGLVTTAYKLLSGVLMLFQKISSKIISQCNECKNTWGAIKENFAKIFGTKDSKRNNNENEEQKEQEEKNRQNDYWNKVSEANKEIDEKNKRKAEKEKDEAFDNYNRK